MRLVHRTRCRNVVLADGLIQGKRIHYQGLADSLHTVLCVTSFNGQEPCCPQNGDVVELPLPGALAWSDSWHVCWNRSQRERRGVYTVHLLPADHLRSRFGDEQELEGFGFELIETAQCNAIDDLLYGLLLNKVQGRRPGAHLHVGICTSLLHVPPQPDHSQPPRCACGNPAAVECQFKYCNLCCLGCERHAGRCLDCADEATKGCPYGKCARCCSGCGAHLRGGPAPGLPSSCRVVGCSGVAAVGCTFHKCSTCCPGCSCHARRPLAGRPGSCGRCRGTAAVGCLNQRCRRCCVGCSLHPGLDGFWGRGQGPLPECVTCGATAALACPNQQCSACCPDCLRHPHVFDSCRGCGATSATECANFMCARCCSGLGCSRHAAVQGVEGPGLVGVSANTPAMALQDMEWPSLQEAAAIPPATANTTNAPAAASTSSNSSSGEVVAVSRDMVSVYERSNRVRSGVAPSSALGPPPGLSREASASATAAVAAPAPAAAGPSTPNVDQAGAAAVVAVGASTNTSRRSSRSNSPSRGHSDVGGGPTGGGLRQEPGEGTPELFHCPLSLEVMEDPVVAADGYTYERSMIATWLARNQRSPLTNEPMETTLLFPNHSLRSAIKEWGTNNALVQIH